MVISSDMPQQQLKLQECTANIKPIYTAAHRKPTVLAKKNLLSSVFHVKNQSLHQPKF
jgi:hypothetical protein